jgi:hypothetical protein
MSVAARRRPADAIENGFQLSALSLSVITFGGIEEMKKLLTVLLSIPIAAVLALPA